MNATASDASEFSGKRVLVTGDTKGRAKQLPIVSVAAEQSSSSRRALLPRKKPTTLLKPISQNPRAQAK